MTEFPSPVQITFASYPATVNLTVDVTPAGSQATSDVEVYANGATMPKYVDFGDNTVTSPMKFSFPVEKGDTLKVITRVRSLSSATITATVTHTINSEPPQSLTDQVPSGTAVKFNGEFVFA